MRIATRITLSTVVISILFMIILGGAIISYGVQANAQTALIAESQPAVQTIEHLLTTIYEDNRLVQEYLSSTEYTTAKIFDSSLTHSQEKCEEIVESVEDLILVERIKDPETIQTYRTAVLTYSSFESSRNTLIELHKQELATGIVQKDQKAAEVKRYTVLFENATSYFTRSLDQVRTRNNEIQKELWQARNTLGILLGVLLGLFVFVTIVAAYTLNKQIAKPLDELIESTKDVAQGKENTPPKQKSKLIEIRQLQEQMTQLFDYTLANTKDTSTLKTKLLPPQYAEVLEFIKAQSALGRAITLKDIKKQFHLTHPTVQARIRFLKEHGHITTEKQGRSVCIMPL